MASVAHNILSFGQTVVRLANTSNAASGSFTEFSDAVQSAVTAMSFDKVEWKPVSGVNQSDVTPLTYEATLEIGQDLKTGSLWNFCLTNHGKIGSIEYYPKGGTTPLVKGNVRLSAPSQVGGAQGAVGTATVTLAFIGTPTITAEP